jgi:DNA modification methylase
MKTKLHIENDGLQSKINPKNSVMNDKMKPIYDSLTESSMSDLTTDFVVPDFLETDAPNKISAEEREEILTISLLPSVLPSLVPALIPSQEDSINPVVDAPVFNLVDVTSIKVDIQLIEPHPLVLKVSKEKNLIGLKMTMRLKGLLEPVKVVQRNAKFQIVDGISRYFAALELGWKTLPVIVADFTDEEIQEQFVFRNYRTKRSIEELTNHAEVILEVIGLSQGKKRERIGGLDLGDNNYSLVGRDRFEIACDVLGTDISPSSLRRLMQVKEFVKNGNEEVKKLDLINRLERGEMKIHQAFNMVENYTKSKKEQGSNELKETLKMVQGSNFKLYNKTCEDLSDLVDESIDCAVDSPPYFRQKDYQRGKVIVNQIGLEKTVDQYVERQVNIRLGLYPKLKKSGSLFIIIADSYDEGVDCLVVEKFIIKMVESGWKFIQKWYWVKDNPKPQNNIKRLLPNYEYCLHFVKDVNAYRWRDFINWKDGEFKLVKGSNERELSKKRETHSWTLQKPIERFRSFLSEQNVTRVLQANGFLWKELEEIDPEYRHQAPYPSVIPLLPMLLTTTVGDTVLDIYNGTSTTTAVALQLGRKAIGYDIDTVNHQFAGKRLQMVEQYLPDQAEILALEAEFTCDRESEDCDSNSAAA